LALSTSAVSLGTIPKGSDVVPIYQYQIFFKFLVLTELCSSVIGSELNIHRGLCCFVPRYNYDRQSLEPTIYNCFRTQAFSPPSLAEELDDNSDVMHAMSYLYKSMDKSG
jgi:hypothetical protein